MATRRRMPPERLAGKETEGLFEPDEAQGLAHAHIDFVVGNFFLNQLIGDVVAHGERIEERAFLKDHAGASAQRERALLGHVRNIFAEEVNAARVGPEQAVGEFERTLLPTPAGPSRMRVSTGATEKLMF